MLRAAFTRPVAALARACARTAGVAPAPMRWTFAQEPTFDNQIASLHLDTREARLKIEKTTQRDWPSLILHDSVSWDR